MSKSNAAHCPDSMAANLASLAQPGKNTFREGMTIEDFGILWNSCLFT